MEDGKLALRFEAGKIVSVSVGAGLYEAYGRLFEAARIELEGSQNKVDSGVSIVVFGCMWIEALCNEYLRELLLRSIVPQTRSRAIWVPLERASTVHKLRALATFGDESEGAEWIRALEQVFQVRNSLVHFRDRDVSAPVLALQDVHELETYLAALPESELNRQLKPPLIEKTAAAIAEGRTRLDAIYHLHVPTERVLLAPDAGIK